MSRRPWLRPFAPFYAAGLWLKNALLAKPQRLDCPVVSVGSLSAGGAGKTPVVIALAKLLRDFGEQVDVLSRGYGRDGNAVARVDPATEHPANLFGDEPVLIAQSAQVPVWVGSDRFCTGQQAESSCPSLHLLDDGFQHRRLHRDMDIVLLTAEDMADTLLPAGNLREPLRALSRADVVVLRDTETHLQEKVWPRLRPGAQIWIVRRSLCFSAPLGVFTAGLRPLAFCALARPEDFAASLREAGCGIVDTLAFRDHHRYSPADIAEVLATAQRLEASGFVTTEKDAVKLTPAMRSRLEAYGPLLVVPLAAEFVDASAVLRSIRSRIEAAR